MKYGYQAWRVSQKRAGVVVSVCRSASSRFLLFGLVPILFSIYISFHKWDMLTDPQWTGLANYKDLLKDEKVFKSLYNTVYLMIGIPLGMILSMPLAILMNRKFAGISFMRTIYYLPVISPIIAVSLLWQWILNQDYGLLNNFCGKHSASPGLTGWASRSG